MRYFFTTLFFLALGVNVHCQTLDSSGIAKLLIGTWIDSTNTNHIITFYQNNTMVEKYNRTNQDSSVSKFLVEYIKTGKMAKGFYISKTTGSITTGLNFSSLNILSIAPNRLKISDFDTEVFKRKN